MKNQKKIFPELFVLFIASCLIVVFSACDDPGDINKDFETFNPTKEVVSFTAGPEGGSFHALNGNVGFIFPEGSLNEQVNFMIKEGPVDIEGEFVIKTIEISPESILFNVPVSLILKYNGQLSCGLNPCSAKCLAIYQFRNEDAFDYRNDGERNFSNFGWSSTCSLNTMDCCIETEIKSGGIFAIGEESLGQKNN